MIFRRHHGIQIKTRDQLDVMRAAGLVVARALEATASAVAPGVTTAELDEVAATVIGDAGAKPSFLGYYGFPATICVSVNDQVVHGIPGGLRLKPGDIVSIDCGAIVDGWHGDAALTVRVPATGPIPGLEDLLYRPESDAQTPSNHEENERPSEGASRDTDALSSATKLSAATDLSAATKRALWAGLDAAVPGNRLTDIGAAVERSLAGSDYGIVTDFVGHGIGTQMHMKPNVPNVGPAGRGPRLQSGMVLAVEPMITLGSAEVFTEADDWTVTTSDGSWAAHWEHTVAITDDGPWVLTEPDRSV